MSGGWSKVKKVEKLLLWSGGGLVFGTPLFLMLALAFDWQWVEQVVPWIVPGIFGGLGVLGLAIGTWKQVRRQALGKRMERAGDELGLLFQPTSYSLSWTRGDDRGTYSALGEWGGNRVRVYAAWDYGDWKPTLGFRVVVDAELPPNLNIARNEPGAFDYHAPSGSPSVKIAGDLSAYSTGIPSFDKEVACREAKEAKLFPVLGAQSRDAILAAVAGAGFRIEEGQVVWRVLERLPSNAEMEEKVALMKGFARVLEKFAALEPSEGLLHHIKNDPAQAFRLRCFDVLLHDFPGSTSAAEALRFANSADDPGLRLLAEFKRSDPRREVIAGLLRAEELPEQLRARGLHLLGDTFAGSLSVEKGESVGGLSVQPSGEGALSRADKSERRPSPQRLKSS